VFIAASLYFTVVFHLTNLYFAKQWEFERFILLEGGIYTQVFWIGQIIIGGMLPLLLLFSPGAAPFASAWCWWPLAGDRRRHVADVRHHHRRSGLPAWSVPGLSESSTFYDGVINSLLRRRSGSTCWAWAASASPSC
jgi:hypothetical protein